ncbi:MAG TPA: hypothetical protein VEC96_10195 [Anaerolineae bacterium]|nr:hypothetical protein [Anaerolineae bacterium]HXV99806.1 hypothetical protein [Anaerolineae bacterium]
MLNSPNNPTVQFTWQALLWRLLLTLLLLSALAGPGLTLFRSVTDRSETRALPNLSQEVERGGWQGEVER